MCYVHGSIEQVISVCPMCKVFMPRGARCPHIRDVCRNRSVHPRIDVAFLKNAEVQTFNGCGHCKAAKHSIPQRYPGQQNGQQGWPGCCRPPNPAEVKFVPVADWPAVCIVHHVSMPPEIKALLDSVGLPTSLRGSSQSSPQSPPISRKSAGLQTSLTPSKGRRVGVNALEPMALGAWSEFSTGLEKLQRARRFPKGRSEDGDQSEPLSRTESDGKSDEQSETEPPLTGIRLVRDTRHEFFTPHPVADGLAASNERITSPQPQITTQPTPSNMSMTPRMQDSASSSSRSRIDDPSEFVTAIPRDTERLPDEPEQIPLVIKMIRSGKDEDTIIRSILGDDIQISIDAINEVVDEPDLPLRTRKKYLKVLYKMCGHHGLLPSAMHITVSYGRDDEALYRGGFADVWKGEYCGRDVAVKVIRTYSDSSLQRMIGGFCKEVVVWKTLRHPNVLPLVGVMISKNQFAMVSDWMMNENIGDFVRAHPDVNRIKLLEGVTEGLIYIHDQGMIHADLKGANILIDQTGSARLADFGLATVISEPTNLLASSSHAHGGTARWMSPELIDPEQFGFKKYCPTKASDCYALGMVIYETISGKLPFHQYTDLNVFFKVVRGERPRRGRGFTDDLWKMLGLCWKPQPDVRPNVEDVLLCLQQASNPPEPESMSPPVGGGAGVGDDDP